MSPWDKDTPQTESGNYRSAEDVLNAVIQELEGLHESVRKQFTEDISRLQSEKNSLIEDIDKLRAQYQQLQSQQVEALSQRSLQQQQLWLKHLAQVLAQNLQEQLIQRFHELSINREDAINPVQTGEFPLPAPLEAYNERASHLLASLDASMTRTFERIQADLNTHESELSQRLNRMQTLKHQGETLLDNLVGRLREELSDEDLEIEANPFAPDISKEIEPEEPAIAPVTAAKQKSPVLQGVIFALMSAGVLSLFNVSLRILIKSPKPRLLFGLFPIEGVVTPGFGNSLLILLLRLIVVMALMPVLATWFYPSVWSDLKRFFNSNDSVLKWKVIGSAFFLFLSQVLIYIAIGNVTPGIAITIFFIYPIVTVFGSWALFGDRPSYRRLLAMGGIVLGLLVAGSPALAKGVGSFGDPALGITAALGSGITFAGYVLLTQMAAGKLHPVPFSLVNFAAIFVFTALSLWVPLPAQLAPKIDPNVWTGLIIGGVILGVLTLFSYLLNNFAIRFAGAALASVIGTLGPALTGLFGLFLIGENLQPIQWLGMGGVTLSVAAMSLERMLAPKKT
ncbi:MAG: EamA family transporter [Microcoleaceae cyanobacterium]